MKSRCTSTCGCASAASISTAMHQFEVLPRRRSRARSPRWRPRNHSSNRRSSRSSSASSYVGKSSGTGDRLQRSNWPMAASNSASALSACITCQVGVRAEVFQQQEALRVVLAGQHLRHAHAGRLRAGRGCAATAARLPCPAANPSRCALGSAPRRAPVAAEAGVGRGARQVRRAGRPSDLPRPGQALCFARRGFRSPWACLRVGHGSRQGKLPAIEFGETDA